MAGEKVLSTLAVRITAQTAELKKQLLKAQNSVQAFKKKSVRAAKDFKQGFSQTLGGGLSTVNPQFAALQNIIGGGTKAMGGLTKGTKLFSKALIATGIGAIVVALTFLYDQLKNTKAGFEIVAKATNVVTAIFGKLMEAVGAIGRSVMKVFKGDFAGAADEAGKAFDALTTGMIDAVDKGIKAGAEEAKLKEMTLQLTKEIAKADSEMVQNRAAARDLSKSGVERLQLANKAIEAGNRKADLSLQLEKQRLKVIQEKNALAESGFEDLQEESDQIAKIAQIEKQRAMDLAEIGEKKRSAVKQIAKETEIMEEQLRIQQQLKDLESKPELEGKGISKATKISEEGDKNKGLFIPSAEDMKKKFDITKKANEEEIKLNQEKIDKIALQEEEARNKKFEMAGTGLEVMAGFANSIATFQNAALQKELAGAGANEKKKEEIRRKYAKKQQKMSIIQALINGALGITKTIGSLGFPAAIPFIALTAATTAAAVSSISSQAFANGGVYGGNIATVGERGAEAMFAPQGTRVVSHNNAMAALRSKSGMEDKGPGESIIRGEDIYIAYNEFARQKGTSL